MKRLGLLLLLLALPLPAGATDYYNLGANVMSRQYTAAVTQANVNLAGPTDLVCLGTSSSGCASPTAELQGAGKLTLQGNDTITIKAGALPITASPSNVLTVQFQICQDGTGNHTLAFGVAGAISQLYWNGGTQPGYTLTANNGDSYSCSYDGTSLRCAETMSNVPC